MTKPRGLLVADVPGWAFDVNERDMAKWLPEYEFDHHCMANGTLPRTSGHDFVFLPMHTWIRNYPYSRICGSLRSQHFTPDKPGITMGDLSLVKRCAAFHVVTRDSYDDLIKTGADNVFYLTNPVDVRRFTPTRVKDVVACWAGNADHKSSVYGDAKGFFGVVVPACSDARVVLRIAEYNTCRVKPDEMPAFFRTASVALCASRYEGASNSVMEAMAAGLAVIATDVGNHSEMVASQMQHYGETGIMLVERSWQAFSRALGLLTPQRVAEMGEINRMEIAERWSWAAWRDRYSEFFRVALAA